MGKLLYIQASPRERSKSKQIGDAFVQAYKQHHPDDEIDTWNMFDSDLPPYDGLAVQGKYNILHGRDFSAEEQAAWKSVEVTIERFKSADKYLFTVPMWNFGIPYRLKQLIDIINQPTYLFGFDPQKGYYGLNTGKPAFIVYSRGGTPPEEMDYQKRYFEFWLRFIGFDQIQSVLFQPTVQADAETLEKIRIQLVSEVQNVAERF